MAATIKDYTVSQIKIMMKLSDPDKEKPIALTSSVLYNPYSKSNAKLDEYPYFTPDVKYPKTVLNGLPYTSRVRFFFDKIYFKKIIEDNWTPPEETDPERDVNYVEPAVPSAATAAAAAVVPSTSATIPRFHDYNIATMIGFLFPTKFPIINNHTNSYDTYIKNEGKQAFDFTVKGAFPHMITHIQENLNVEYSYIKSDKIYTITKVIWLNDFFNNPVYRSLLENYNSFNKWRTKKNKDIDGDITIRKKRLLTNINKQINDNTKKYKIIKGLIELQKSISKTDKQKYIITSTEDLNKYKEELIVIIVKMYTIEFTLHTNTIESFNTKTQEELKKYINNTIKFNVFTATKDEDKVFELVEEVREKLKNKPSGVNLNTDLNNNIKLLIDESRRIQNLDAINDKYFKNLENININFEEDDDDMRKDFTETNYKEYFEFIKSIKMLIKPNTETTNKKLQKIIYEYTQGDTTTFGTYLKYIKEVYLDSSKNTTFPNELNGLLNGLLNGPKSDRPTEPLYVGLNYSQNAKPTYEIYVLMDVILGEVKEENISELKCSYTGEDLGEKFEKLRHKQHNKYDIGNHQMFFNINKIADAKNAKKKELDEHEKNKSILSKSNNVKLPPPPQKHVKIKGGKNKTKQRCKTRKRKTYSFYKTRKYRTKII